MCWGFDFKTIYSNYYEQYFRFFTLQKELVQEQEEENIAPFMRKPFCTYKGHSADLLDISWSKVRNSFKDLESNCEFGIVAFADLVAYLILIYFVQFWNGKYYNIMM